MVSEEFCCAVDLGATNVRCAIMGTNGELYGHCRGTVAGLSDGEAISAKIVDMIESAVECSNVTPKAVGISTAGPVDLKRGSVANSPNMRANEIFLRDPILEALGLPTVMLTDCKAGAYGEYVFGGHSAASTLVYLTMSTGIGAGVLQNGEVLQGSTGNAGEMGHCIVDTVYNLRCGCGGFGHWEAYSSGSGLPRFFSEWCRQRGISLPLATSEGILSAAREGDPRCLAFVEEVAEMNRRGLSTVVCAYNPDVIVLDGPLAREYSDLLISGVDGYLKPPKICVTNLGGNAPLLGAGAYAFKENI